MISLWLTTRANVNQIEAAHQVEFQPLRQSSMSFRLYRAARESLLLTATHPDMV